MTYNPDLRQAEERIERIVRAGSFEIGNELIYIQENWVRIRNEDYPGYTFLQYCQERWEWSEPRIYQLINAAKVYGLLQNSQNSRNSLVLPTRASHVEPLQKIDEKYQAEVWQRVVDSGERITAKLVEAEVARKIAELEKNWITLDQWNNLSPAEQHLLLTQPYQNKKSMNQTNDNIEWAMWSWNPVTGCLHGCDYCYARDIAERFYPQKFAPSFIPERLTMPANTDMPRPRHKDDFGYKGVFVCSMADLFGKWVPEEWIRAVLDVVSDNPQWNFLMLTKFPIRMAEFDYPDNVWLGTTADRQWAVERAEKGFTKIKESGFNGICWLSCEPMLENLNFTSLNMFDWLVMGGATKSTKTSEYLPPMRDILNLIVQADLHNVPVYMKTNLIPGMNETQRLREYPRGL